MHKSMFSKIKCSFLSLRKNPTKDNDAWSFHRREQLLIRRDLEYLSEIAWWELCEGYFLPELIFLFVGYRDVIYFVKRKKMSKLWALGLSAGELSGVQRRSVSWTLAQILIIFNALNHHNLPHQLGHVTVLWLLSLEISLALQALILLKTGGLWR